MSRCNSSKAGGITPGLASLLIAQQSSKSSRKRMTMCGCVSVGRGGGGGGGLVARVD